MSKKILVLNGSPRKGGNTALLCRSFTEGAQAEGHTVTQFDLHFMTIKSCIGCMKGGRDPSSPCVQKDDMDKVYPAYKEAEIIVLASPMYYWSVTGQLKTAFDRLYAVAEIAGGEKNPVKDCILLMAAGSDSPEDWKPVADFYHRLLERLGWTDRGMILAGGVFEVGEIAGKEALAEAFALGSSIMA